MLRILLAFLILVILHKRACDAALNEKSLPPSYRGRLCDSDWIRTNGPHLRRMTLYPAELPNRLSPWQNIALGLQNKDNLSVFQRKFDSNWSTSILYHQITNHHTSHCAAKNGRHIAQCAND